jgi:predicted esterase YcpF (UPF0227 family)
MEDSMTTIIYFHGWGSIGDSIKSRSLKSEFNSYTVIAPDLPVNPIEVEKLVDDLIKECTDYPIILVGTSLGGFYANYFAHKFNIQCFLINPSTNPSKTLERKLGDNINYATKEHFEFKEEYLKRYSEMETLINKSIDCNLITLFLSRDDDVIDYQSTLKVLTKCKTVITDDGGHRFEKHWNLVIDQIKETL